MDILSLMPRAKTLLLGDLNSIGRIGKDFLGSAEPGSEATDKHLPIFSPPGPNIELPGVTTPDIESDRSNYAGNNDVLFADVSANDVIVQSKLQLQLQCKHIFDARYFVNNYSTAFYYSANRFELRRVGFLGLAYKF